MYPSLWAHSLGGVLMLAAVALSVLNFGKLKTLGTYSMIKILMMLSIVVTLHGISHVLLEKQYSYNPWTIIFG
uniref:Uncharacterized protein n=1 Tax=viral metagenome TaxID=1070528 RepID=A0A6C0I7G0_9ZZZZ